MQHTEIYDTGRLLRLKQVIQITGLSRPTIYRKMTEPASRGGAFPRPVKLGQRVSAWPENEVHAWIEAQIARRDAPSV